MKYTTLGVSAGNGVMLYPFKDSLLGNVEIRRDYLIGGKPYQWRINFGDIPLYSSLPDNLSPDFIVGHPKCGNSSVFALSRGKKFTTSRDEPTLTLFIESINKYKPKIWAMENLPKLLETYSIEEISKSVNDEYIVKAISGPVSIYGNSQVTRKRLLVLGFRKGVFSKIAILRFITGLKLRNFTPSNFSELTQKMGINGRDTENLRSEISVYGGFKTSLANMQQFWKDNPELRHYPIQGGNMSTAPGVYINRANDIPLTVRKTNRQFNSEGIQMSPRELARIQGIPDDFKIVDDIDIAPLTTLINKGRMTVANTPPYEIGQRLYDQLNYITS